MASNNHAEKLGVETTKKLYMSRDTDDDADWTIVSNNNRQSQKSKVFKVHSLIVKHKSNVLMTMMTGDFIEKKNKMIHLNYFTTMAVQYFIKFMYCFDLDHDDNLDLETLKELIEMGDKYNVPDLKKAASKSMEKFFSKDNIFEILDCKILHQADALERKACFKFIINNFEVAQLKKDGIFEKHPDLAVMCLDLLAESRSIDITDICRNVLTKKKQM